MTLILWCSSGYHPVTPYHLPTLRSLTYLGPWSSDLDLLATEGAASFSSLTTLALINVNPTFLNDFLEQRQARSSLFNQLRKVAIDVAPTFTHKECKMEELLRFLAAEAVKIEVLSLSGAPSSPFTQTEDRLLLPPSLRTLVVEDSLPHFTRVMGCGTVGYDVCDHGLNKRIRRMRHLRRPETVRYLTLDEQMELAQDVCEESR